MSDSPIRRICKIASTEGYPKNTIDKKSPASPACSTLDESQVFEPRWPTGITDLETYQVLCDDKGRDGGSWLRVLIAGDGDVHVSMQDWENIKEEGTKPSCFPSVRIRTYDGGGRNIRTRQALLWLARAIMLDNEENKR